ncbi:Uncharacterized protein PBTT_06658 [Plasmodiophora brassicae]|uniref:Uncharacterized protein n=1 Tax=Plasmodiophora brassicae TaxID=37360 RepID=A0A3P3YB01_PLABS|nr:unnamed protein product [Plasmodiophora brassicae]
MDARGSQTSSAASDATSYNDSASTGRPTTPRTRKGSGSKLSSIGSSDTAVAGRFTISDIGVSSTVAPEGVTTSSSVSLEGRTMTGSDPMRLLSALQYSVQTLVDENRRLKEEIAWLRKINVQNDLGRQPK